MLLLVLMLSGFASADPNDTKFADKPEHLVLLLIDGLSYKVWDNMELPNLEKMIAGGSLLEKVYLPPAAHPTAGAYAELHTGSIPNPVMMSGTIFIDRDTEYLQKCFYPEKTAVFVTNTRAYESISDKYHATHQKSGPNSEAVEKALEFMEYYKPSFTRLHLQDTGGAGTRSMRAEEDVPWRWNIWAEGSPYRVEMARVDSLVGVFVDCLEKLGILEKTAIIICGDHGQHDTGWHPPEFQDSAITTGVLWGAGLKKGVRIPYAELIDLAPTVCDLMNVQHPSSSIGHTLHETMTGRESHSSNRKREIRDLNELLSGYREKSIRALWLLENSASGKKGQYYLRFQREIREKFYTIDRFSEWPDFSSLESLIAHNRDVLNSLDTLLSEMNAER